MLRTFAASVALVTLLSLPFVAGAQLEPRAEEWGTVQGEVRDVSPSGETFTLWDGTRLRFAETPAFVTDVLQPGAFVTATYERQGAENIVTSIMIQSPFGRT